MDNVDDLSQLGTVRSDFSSFLANNPHLESSMAQKYAQTQGDYGKFCSSCCIVGILTWLSEEYMRKQQRKQAKKDEKIRQKKEDQQRENEIQARVNEALKKQKKKDKTRRRK